MLIYKIFRRAEWRALEDAGHTPGAPVDLADGFIHFSTAGQVRETAARHFYMVPDLVLAAVESETLGTDLKWETSRGGAQFPHLYRSLNRSDVVAVSDLPLGPEGHVFPEDIK